GVGTPATVPHYRHGLVVCAVHRGAACGTGAAGRTVDPRGIPGVGHGLHRHQPAGTAVPRVRGGAVCRHHRAGPATGVAADRSAPGGARGPRGRALRCGAPRVRMRVGAGRWRADPARGAPGGCAHLPARRARHQPGRDRGDHGRLPRAAGDGCGAFSRFLGGRGRGGLAVGRIRQVRLAAAAPHRGRENHGVAGVCRHDAARPDARRRVPRLGGTGCLGGERAGAAGVAGGCRRHSGAFRAGAGAAGRGAVDLLGSRRVRRGELHRVLCYRQTRFPRGWADGGPEAHRLAGRGVRLGVRTPLRPPHPGSDPAGHGAGGRTAAVNRLAQGMVMVLLGAAALSVTVASQDYLNYVRGEFRPFLIAAGAVLVLLGLVAVVAELRSPEDEAEPGHDPAHGHDHGRAPVVAWLLLLPVVVIFVVAPPALGAYTAAAADPAAAVERALPDDVPADTPDADGPVEMSLREFVVRAWTDEER